MNRVGQYISRALRAYYAGDWDDLLLQLCPCIDAAASLEYGGGGRSSFRRFVDDNFYIASVAGLGPEIRNFSVAVRVRGIFDEQVVQELSKVSYVQEKWEIEPSDSPTLVKIKQDAEESRQKSMRDMSDAGAMCVPFGHILYHCLRCELLHRPNAPEVISFHRKRVIDNQDYNLTLPISLLWGYILAVVISPAFVDERHVLDETIVWNSLGACSRLDWLWGRRESFDYLISMNREAMSAKQ